MVSGIPFDNSLIVDEGLSDPKDKKYYSFQIISEKDKSTLNLATKTLDDKREWIALLRGLRTTANRPKAVKTLTSSDAQNTSLCLSKSFGLKEKKEI